MKTRITHMRYGVGLMACLLLLAAIVAYYLFTPLSASDTTEWVYVDDDDNVDSLLAKVEKVAAPHAYTAFATLLRHAGLGENLHTGRYQVEPDDLTFNVFRNIKNGRQVPLSLTIPSVRTKERLAAELAKHLMADSTAFMAYFASEDSCRRFDLDTLTIVSMFIPNTYEVYWNTPAGKFLDRMKKESDAFWNENRLAKAEKLGLAPVEVITLASIIDEETANNGEKPRVAGMYYNRIRKGMPLQADPTVKFALGDFSLRRIYRNMLTVNSPYNTYVVNGLPPGPIRIPSVAGIDAVLNLEHHDYVYMCAKEDFSGTHNFAVTYAEHMQNAKRYSEALNARNIQ